MRCMSLQCLKLCTRTSSLLNKWNRRFQSTCNHHDLGPVQKQDHQTVRTRKEGYALPVPPVLDPVVLEKRSKWEGTKERPQIEKLTPFQRKLLANPYAHILASPVRFCRSTQTAHPRSLLLSLHPRPHPETAEPWLLPVSLTTAQEHLGPPYRFLNRQNVAIHLGKKKAWEKGIYERMTQKLGWHACQKIKWREDMHVLVLALLRQKVLTKLKWWFHRRGRLVGVESPREEDLEGIENVSSVFIVRSLTTPMLHDVHSQMTQIADEAEKWTSYCLKNYAEKLDPHKRAGASHTSPIWYTEPYIPRLQPRVRFPELHFPTAVWKGRKVALYSLTDLLGEEKVRELMDGSACKGERCVVMKSGQHNVTIEILLMQLQAYLAQSKP